MKQRRSIGDSDRGPRRDGLMGPALVWLLAVACSPDGGSGGDGPSGGGGDWTPLDAPAVVPPSEPGYLAIGPVVVGLEAGETAQLTATLYDSFGNPQPAPEWTWASSDESVATVSAGGLVTAVDAGFATIAVTDGSHGEASVAIVVIDPSAQPRDTLAGRPTSLICSPAFQQVDLGDTVGLGATVADLFGDPVDADDAGVTFRLSGSGQATLNDDGTLTANGAGVAIVEAIDENGQVLPGSCVVAIGAPAAGPCDIGDPVVDGCSFIWPPRYFSRPGLTARPLRVQVQRSRSGCGYFSWWLSQQSPDALEVSLGGVASVTGGLLTSRSPGRTTVRGFVEGVDCGSFSVTVDLGIAGSWDGRCENEDAVCLDVDPFPDFVDSGPNPHVVHQSEAWSEVMNEDGFECTEDDDNWLVSEVRSGRDILCSEAMPCSGIGAEECGRSRHGGGEGQVLGADSFRSGSCHYVRRSEPCRCVVWRDPSSDWGPSCCGWQIDEEGCFAMFPDCCDRVAEIEAVFDQEAMDQFRACMRETTPCGELASCGANECESTCRIEAWAARINEICPGIGDCLCP